MCEHLLPRGPSCPADPSATLVPTPASGDCSLCWILTQFSFSPRYKLSGFSCPSCARPGIRALHRTHPVHPSCRTATCLLGCGARGPAHLLQLPSPAAGSSTLRTVYPPGVSAAAASARRPLPTTFRRPRAPLRGAHRAGSRGPPRAARPRNETPSVVPFDVCHLRLCFGSLKRPLGFLSAPLFFRPLIFDLSNIWFQTRVLQTRGGCATDPHPTRQLLSSEK